LVLLFLHFSTHPKIAGARGRSSPEKGESCFLGGLESQYEKYRIKINRKNQIKSNSRSYLEKEFFFFFLTIWSEKLYWQ
jgi:hypothetical protein